MELLFKQFGDYFHSYQIVKDGVKFTFLPYDLVDKDIDLDEVEYDRHKDAFRKELDKLVRTQPLQKGSTFQSDEHFLISRNVFQPGSRCTQYTPVANGKIMRTVTELL